MNKTSAPDFSGADRYIEVVAATVYRRLHSGTHTA